MIKVLLVSPTDPEKPSNLKFLVGGENTFTRSLLENPPDGFEYTLHFDAEKKGLIEYTFLHKLLNMLVLLRILPMSAGTQVLKLNSDFDLIHCHGYSIKVVNKNIPIIFSDSSSNYIFLKDYLGWREWRVKLGFSLRRNLFRLLGVIDCDTNWEKANKIIVFSRFAEKVHRKFEIPQLKLRVIYPGIIGSKKVKNKIKKEVNILFVGTWFERKGGLLLVEAFKRLSKKHKNISLTVVGPIPKRFKIDPSISLRQNSGFTQKVHPEGQALRTSDLRFKNYDYIPRERLMREFFPKADIFVLIPPKVEGFGFSVLEAMSFGIPVIVSRVCALPELVEDGKSGFVIKPGSIKELTDRLEILIENSILRKRMGRLARKRFEEKFSIDKSNENLLKVYRRALL